MRDQEDLQFLDIFLNHFITVWLTDYMNCDLLLAQFRKFSVEVFVSSDVDWRFQRPA